MKKKFWVFIVITLIIISCEEVFYVDDISKEVVGLISPTDNAVFDKQQVNLNWSKITEATQYHLQIATPSFANANQIVKDTLLEITNFSLALVPNSYQWRVKALNSQYETAYQTNSFEIITLNPEDEVVLLSPENEWITNIKEHTLKWNAIDYAESYTVQIWNPNTSGTLVQEITSETTEAAVVFDEGTFVWQVKASNQFKSTEFSSRAILVDVTIPNTPQLQLPENQFSTINTMIDFKWSRAKVEGSREVDSLYVFNDETLKLLKYKDKVDSFETQLALEIGTYYWFVQSFDQAGNISDQSDVFSFTIDQGIAQNEVELFTPEDFLITNNPYQLFSWNAIEYAKGYQLKIELKESSTAIFDITTEQTEKEIYLQDGDYLWKVRGFNDLEQTVYSERNLLIDTKAPNIPQLMNPLDEASLDEKMVHFKFSRTEIDGSQEIDSLRVFSDSELTSLVLNKKVLDFNDYQELEVGTYYWYVQSYDLAGNSSERSELFSFTIKESFRNSPIELVSPEMELVTNKSTQTFEWMAVENAIEYQMQVVTFENENLLQDFSLPITKKTLTLNDGHYLWRVRAKNEFEYTEFYSRTIEIDTQSPSKPMLTQPEDGSTSSNTTVTFSWQTTPNTGSQETSTVKVYKDVGLTDVLEEKDTQGTSIFMDVPPGTYYWVVNIVDKAGNVSEQSDIFSFTIE